jgi:uncharacterized protein
MEIKQDEHGRKGAFYIDEDGEWVAELSYVRADDTTMVIDHTEVDEKFRDQDVGRDLVEAAVGFARENGMKIRPDCPFARKVIEETPEFQDVLA